jgi:hypothetical protein
MSGRDDMQFEAPHTFGPDRRTAWHIERTINVSEIFGALCLLASVLWLGGRLEERIGQLERTRTEDVSRYERQRAEDLARQQRDRDEVMQRLQAIDNKLDRALQAGPGR